MRSPRRGHRRRARAADDQGQSTVELALVLPFVVVALLLVVQVGVVAHDQVLVTHAAREAARAASVSADPDAPRRAAVAGGGLDPSRLTVTTEGRAGPGSVVRVHLEYRSPVRLPLVRIAAADVALRADAAMRVETDR